MDYNEAGKSYTLIVDGVEITYNYHDFRGVSTAIKPTDHVATGSTYYEIDTKKVCMYHQPSETWY